MLDTLARLYVQCNSNDDDGNVGGGDNSSSNDQYTQHCIQFSHIINSSAQSFRPYWNLSVNTHCFFVYTRRRPPFEMWLDGHIKLNKQMLLVRMYEWNGRCYQFEHTHTVECFVRRQFNAPVIFSIFSFSAVNLATYVFVYGVYKSKSNRTWTGERERGGYAECSWKIKLL